MKKVFLSASLLVVLLTAHGQNTPQLGKDPIDKVIAAMTTEEKVSLLIGTGMPGFGGQSAVVGSTQSINRIDLLLYRLSGSDLAGLYLEHGLS